MIFDKIGDADLCQLKSNIHFSLRFTSGVSYDKQKERPALQR